MELGNVVMTRGLGDIGPEVEAGRRLEHRRVGDLASAGSGAFGLLVVVGGVRQHLGGVGGVDVLGAGRRVVDERDLGAALLRAGDLDVGLGSLGRLVVEPELEDLVVRRIAVVLAAHVDLHRMGTTICCTNSLTFSAGTGTSVPSARWWVTARSGETW